MPGPDALLRSRQLLIFDLDGTLADTSPVHAAAFSIALAPHGVTVDYDMVAGLATPDAIRRLLALAGRQADDATVTALVAAKRSAAHSGLADVQAIPGARAFVTAASATHRLALCTSAARSTADVTLAALDLTRWFDPIVTADDVALAKPAPDGFLAILDRTGTAAADALIFEDSVAGLSAARTAGIDAIQIGAGQAGWAELAAALEGVSA